MYLLIDYENVVLFASSTLDYQENGNALINYGTLAIPSDLFAKIVEVEEIPEDWKENKYCYSDDNEFYLNPNYQEGINSEEEFENLKNEMQVLRETIDMLVELQADIIGGAI